MLMKQKEEARKACNLTRHILQKDVVFFFSGSFCNSLLSLDYARECLNRLIGFGITRLPRAAENYLR